MNGHKGRIGKAGAALAALCLVLSPALALAASSKAKTNAASYRSGSFTPAVSDRRLAAALARRGVQPGSFRLTPASASPEKSKAVRVAVRARPASPVPGTTASAAVTTITPSNYNLGVTAGWKRFALSGDVARSEDQGIPGERESARLGVSYDGRKIGGRIQVAAERADGAQRLVGADATYLLDVGASYSIARNIDVTGGVRYKIQRDRLEAINEERRDSQAVYIGTAFRF